MARTPYYLLALQAMTHPATLDEICDKAEELFGEKVKASRQSSRWSLERFVLNGKALKVHEGNGRTVYIQITDPLFAQRKLEWQIAETEVALIKMRAALADLKSACNAQAACYDSLTQTPNEA